jgi:hypothetical protein
MTVGAQKNGFSGVSTLQFNLTKTFASLSPQDQSLRDMGVKL